MNELLVQTAARAAKYANEIGNRRVAPRPEDIARLEALGGPLPQRPSDPAEVLALLDDIGSPATVATTGGRYFGFVIGGVLPAALAANWLAGAWDQNAALYVMSPVAARIEEIVLAWIIDLFGCPRPARPALSPVRRWRTSLRCPQPERYCSSAWAGTSKKTVCSRHHRSGWW